MKKILFAIVLSAGTTMAFAQTKTSTTYNATEASQQMYEDLRLNEGQYLRVRSLNNIKEDRLKDIEALHRDDPQAREQKIQALNAEMDREFRQILRPDQYEMYRDMETSTASGQEMNNRDTHISPQGADEDGMIMHESGDVKVKTDEDSDRVKIKTEDSKVKVKDDKVKMKDKNSKVKVEDDKVKIKSRD